MIEQLKFVYLLLKMDIFILLTAAGEKNSRPEWQKWFPGSVGFSDSPFNLEHLLQDPLFQPVRDS